ncbi:LAMI_0B05292g1_1 [Lachancea mirantina]|uniref:LAMI_0B05292g1_1 n=1 Tax=Lachancea mirantina TaxID=1230905 RepID=A0A1G4IW44_9SACH|nr:LAMI_0B05292g1_1 [Lachancea mirantina]
MNSDTVDSRNRNAAYERYAPHLSEFYSMVSDQKGVPESNNVEETEAVILQSPARISSASAMLGARRASSLRSGMSSVSELQTLVTQKDMGQTVDVMSQVLSSINAYSEELRTVSQRASMVAVSLEQMARLKGCNDATAEKYLSSSGLFHVMANHQRIMSECIATTMGATLAERIEDFKYKRRVQEARFKQEFQGETRKLKLQEKFNQKFAQRKTRNLVSYRENLANLQLQLDEIETLKHKYYQDSYDLVQATCADVLKDVATVSRAQVEISENIARKGWSGGGLDELMIDADDPFNKNTSNADQSDESDKLGSHMSSFNTPFSTRERSTPISTGVRMQTESPVNRSGDLEDADDTFDNSFSLPAPGANINGSYGESHSDKDDARESNHSQGADDDQPKILDGINGPVT